MRSDSSVDLEIGESMGEARGAPGLIVYFKEVEAWDGKRQEHCWRSRRIETRTAAYASCQVEVATGLLMQYKARQGRIAMRKGLKFSSEIDEWERFANSAPAKEE